MTESLQDRIFYTNDIGKELSILEESAALIENENDTMVSSLFCEMLIPVYTFLGLRNHALLRFNKLKKFAQDTPSPLIDSLLLHSKITLLREGLLQLSIEESITLALSLLDETKGDFKGKVYHSLIILWILRGNLEVAENLYKESKKIENMGESISWLIKREEALINLMKGEKEKAIEVYRELLNNNTEGIYSTQILMELYRLTNDEKYYTHARNNILYIMKSLPDDIKRVFVNRSQIKLFLLKQ